jgi:SAM-dependent methyltransferase
MAAQAQTTWGVGEYELIADRLEPASREIVDRARVIAADRVLDLACGTGNAALIAARRGASVTGVDFEPRLLAIAADRARDSVAVAFLLATAGHVLAEGSRLREERRWDQLRTDLELLVAERDTGRSTGVTLECEYLVVLAEKAS